jgi:hypothetical protein
MPAPDPRPWSNRMESIRALYGPLTASGPLPVQEAKRTGGEKMISPSPVRGPRVFKTGLNRTARGFWLPVTRFRGIPRFFKIFPNSAVQTATKTGTRSMFLTNNA